MPPMVDVSLYTAFLLAAFVLCVTPGPDMMFIVAMGGRGGPSAGVMAAFGVACAMFVHAELGHVPGQFMLLGVTFVVMGCCVDGSVGLLSGKLAGLLRRSRRVARGLHVFSGTVFTGPAVRLAAAPK